MKFLAATSTLVGMIVGVGVFAIPYAVARSGFLVGLFYFFVVGGLVLLVHRFYGDIVSETPGRHRLIGYAAEYLGNWARRVVTLTTLLGVAGGLLVYLVVGAQFFGVLVRGGEGLAVVGMVILGLAAAMAGFRSFGRFELFMTAFLLFTMLLLFVSSLQHFRPFGLFEIGSGRALFLPYGILLFASSGTVAVPLLADLLRGERPASGPGAGKAGRRRLALAI
ncbi:hypothetical protein HYW30_01370, partial [Candidatus Azambacteria bacterium]|nr:hypothetical protein [Candidatus Azambacteria bacterium]